MGTPLRRLVGERLTEPRLRYLAAGLAYVVAAIHLFHPRRGFPRLATVLTTGDASLLLSDPRPLAFVLSGFAILAGVSVVHLGVRRRPVYAIGIGLVSLYLVGYVGWHLSGHGGVLPGREPHFHGMHPVEAVMSHLVEYPLARAAKLAELGLLVVLVVLYRRETLE